MTTDEWAGLWDLLCERFKREPSSDLGVFYLDTLEDKLSDDQIRTGVQQVLYGDTYWPSPGRIVEAARGSSEDDALDQWEICRQIMSDRRKADELIEQMSDEGRRVVRAMGGPAELCRTKMDEVAWRRKEFLRLYGTDGDDAGRDTLPPMTDDGRKQLREATGDLELLSETETA